MPVLGRDAFRVELNTVHTALLAGHRRDRDRRRDRGDGEAGRGGFHFVAVAHPANQFAVQAREKIVVVADI